MANRVPSTAPLAGRLPRAARLLYAGRSSHLGMANALEHLVILPDKPNVVSDVIAYCTGLYDTI